MTTSALTQGLERIPDQLGYLVISEDGVLAESSCWWVPAVVHEVNGENGVHQLSANEVDELIHKADESMMSDVTTAAIAPVIPNQPPEPAAEQQATPQKEITCD
ncbi:hypothetical protein DPEC_G00362960 [Dallia pectoralis]|nr:hypothetical protein DPEC_G00362960 [Dallia pectoralis]